MHRIDRWAAAAVAVVGLVAGACHNDTVAPNPASDAGLTSQEMAEIALEGDGLTEGIFADQLAAAPAAATSGGAPITTEYDFSMSHPCPAGGEVTVEANFRREFDPATTVLEATLHGTHTRSDCAFRRREYIVTVNGSATLDVFRRLVGGIPDGPQTTHYFGSFHALRSDGEERSCSFDIEIVRDPRAHTRTLTGTICGDPVHRFRDWDSRD